MVKNVLLVDDDRAMLRMLREGLSGYAGSFAVLLAGDGMEALECIKHHEVSLVVTDLKMPRMDGFELLRAILNGYPDIPVIVMTGFSAPGIESMAHRGGAVGFIVKPFLTDDLAQRILATLQKETEGGTLHNVSTGMFLQLIEMEQRTCTLRLTDQASGKTGALFFMEGGLVDARVGALQGEDAAYMIFGWDHVSLSIQNGCAVRTKRIHPELNLMILEAMRRKDEAVPALEGDEENPPSKGGVSLQRLRDRIFRTLGTQGGSFEIIRNHDWSRRMKRISTCGTRLNLGSLTLGYVDKGDARDYVLMPPEKGAVIAVSPTCPRDKLLQSLAE